MSTINQRVIARARKRYGLRVFTRAQWGSKYGSVYETRRRTKPAKQPADTVVQHITVTEDHGVLTGAFFADVRTVERIGYERFKSGISYNWVVDMVTGDIAEGQPLDAKGTHTVNNKDVPNFSHDQNYAARAIAVLGMPDDKLSGKAARSIAGLLAAMMDERAITDHFDYMPHSHFAWKDCPCDSTRNQMGNIKKLAHSLRTAPRPAAPRTVTSDVRFVLANVKSNPLMSPARAREDYELAFAGAKKKRAQSVYVNEFHKTYGPVLAATAKAHGYKVRSTDVASGLAVATKATGWTLNGLAFSLLAGGIRRISPNRGVLRVGEKTPAGTRVVWDCLMLPRGWNNPKYAGYAKTSAMARTIFAKLKPIVANQIGPLKSVAVIGGDVNQGAEVDWERHLGLKPAATLVCPGNALDKMMQAAVFAPAGATAEVVEQTNLGKENTDHGIFFGHVRVTRPR